MYILLVWCSVIAAVLGSHIHGGGLYLENHGEYAAAYDNYQPHDYQFNYAVSDPHTGDHKSQWEVKEQGVVRGGYSLLEPDGTTRIVEYVADDNGFRAVVKKLGTAIHPSTVESHGFSGGYAEGATIVQSAVPIATKVTVPVATSVEVPIATKVEVPVLSKVEVPVATKIEVPLTQNIEYTVPSVQSNIGWAPGAEYVAVAKEAQAPIFTQAFGNQYVEQVPTYSAYDGRVSNYANVLNAAVQHLEPLSYKRPIEIPQSVELHGWQAPSGWDKIGAAGRWNGISTAGWGKIGSYAIPQQSTPILTSQNLQYQSSGYDYRVPHPSAVVNEILVPKAPGFSNIGYGNQAQASYSLCPDGAHQVQQQTLQSIEQPQITVKEQPRLPQPSVQVSSQVHGTTGNLADDSAYTNYGASVGNYQQNNLGGNYQQGGNYLQSSAGYSTQGTAGYASQSPTGYASQSLAGYASHIPAGYATQSSAGYASQSPASYGIAPSYGTQSIASSGKAPASYATQSLSSSGTAPANFAAQSLASYETQAPVSYETLSSASYGSSPKFARSYSTSSNLVPNQHSKLPYSSVVSHPVLK